MREQEFVSVLSHVFSYLQISDILPNIPLVCHKWKDIVYQLPIWSTMNLTDKISCDITLKNICQVSYLKDKLQHLIIEGKISNSQMINISKSFPSLRTVSVMVHGLKGEDLLKFIEPLQDLVALSVAAEVHEVQALQYDQFMKLLGMRKLRYLLLDINISFTSISSSIHRYFEQNGSSLSFVSFGTSIDKHIQMWKNEFCHSARSWPTIELCQRLPELTLLEGQPRPPLPEMNYSVGGPSKYRPNYVDLHRVFVYAHGRIFQNYSRHYYFRRVNPSLETKPKEEVVEDFLALIKSLEEVSEGLDLFVAFKFSTFPHRLVADHTELWTRAMSLIMQKFTVLIKLPYSASITSEERSSFILKWFPGCFLRTKAPSGNLKPAPISELILYMRNGCKFDWSYRGLYEMGVRRPSECWLANHMIHHFFDRLWKCVPESVRSQPYGTKMIPHTIVDKSMRYLLPQALLEEYLVRVSATDIDVYTQWTLEDGEYEHTSEIFFWNLRSVRLALTRYGNFTSAATLLVTVAVVSLVTYLRNNVFRRHRNSEYLFVYFRNDNVLDSLFWDMPLHRTFWYAFSPVDGERTGSFNKHIRLSPAPYTGDQQELIEEENRLRIMLIQDRDNEELVDPYFNLVNVFENRDQFNYQPLTNEEKRIPVLLESEFYKRSAESFEPKQSSICSQEEFTERWETFTHGVFKGIDFSNLFVAGGAVLGTLNADGVNNYKNSDIDLFIYGLDESAADAKLTSVLQSILANCPEYTARYCNQKVYKRCQIFRSKNSITIMRGYPYRHIQIVLRLYKSPAEILLGFDIDCCSVGFDGSKVYCTPRCIRSLNKRYNLVNLTRRSTTYEYRLFKYGKRGFTVLVPMLDGSKIDTSIYMKKPTQVDGLAKLLLYDYDRRPEMAVSATTAIRTQVKDTCSRKLVPRDPYDKENMMNLENASDYGMALPFGPNWDFPNTTRFIEAHNWKQWHKWKGNYLKMVDPEQKDWLQICTEGVVWMTINPGQQTYETTNRMMSGSFQPLTGDTWENDAYNK